MAKVKLTIAEPSEDEMVQPEVEPMVDHGQPRAGEQPSVAQGKKPAASKGAPDSTSNKKKQPVQGLAAYLTKFAPNHENALLGGLMGLIVAVLMFVAGFWRTLFVVVMVTIGVAIGQYLDGTPKIINFIRRVIAEFRGTN
jgi:uncharacterized membrane protein